MDGLEARASAPIEEAEFVEAVQASNSSNLPIRIENRGGDVTAQKVALPRDYAVIKKNIKILAAEAGEDWYYRFPTKNKDGSTGWIEGPSVDCAEAVASVFGNCKIDCVSQDNGTHFVFLARYADLETGFNLSRPFQQRKGQNVGKRMDADRAQDIVYQIGASKATRNVICNSLKIWTNLAFQEAKQNLADKIGKNIAHYKTKVIERLGDLQIPLQRVERVYAKKISDFLAHELARLIAEIKAIDEGMANREDCYPPTPEEEAAHMEQIKQTQTADKPREMKPTIDWVKALEEVLISIQSATSMESLQDLIDENKNSIETISNTAPPEIKAMYGREYARLITKFSAKEPPEEMKPDKTLLDAPEVPVPMKNEQPDWVQFHSDLIEALTLLKQPEQFALFEKKNGANIKKMARMMKPDSIVSIIEKGKAKKVKA